MNYFSIRCLHREISATHSNVTTFSIFHSLLPVRDIVSVIILVEKCVLWGGTVEGGVPSDFCFPIL